MTTNISLKMKKYSSEKSDLDQKLLDDELDEILELAKVKFKFEEDCKAARGFHRLWLQYIIAPTAQEVHSSEELKELEKRGYGISAKWLVWFTVIIFTFKSIICF
jgi:hypothetical protein